MATNMQSKVVSPAELAQQAAVAAQRAKDASKKPAPAQAPDSDVLAAILARLNALEEEKNTLAAENAALKAGKAASKAAPKSPITCKNCTWEHDQKTDELVIRVKLHADILDETTGLPKVSSTGNTTGVAQLSGSLVDKNGRKVGVSLNAYHKLTK